MSSNITESRTIHIPGRTGRPAILDENHRPTRNSHGAYAVSDEPYKRTRGNDGGGGGRALISGIRPDPDNVAPSFTPNASRRSEDMQPAAQRRRGIA